MKTLGTRRIASFSAITLLCLGIATGCDILSRKFVMPEGSSTGKAYAIPDFKLHVVWDKHIVYAPDTLHGGKPMPGLHGTLVFGDPTSDNVLEAPEGVLTVHLHDATPRPEGIESTERERWILTSQDLKLLQTKAWGLTTYSLFLPWLSYTENVTEINILSEFKASGYSMISAPVEHLTLDHTASIENKKRVLGITPGPSNMLPYPNSQPR